MTDESVSRPARPWRQPLRRTLAVLLGVALAAGLVWPPAAGSGSADLMMAGRSYSSGNFSFGKSGSTGGRTFPSGGRSYSSGGSRPSFSGGSRPSFSGGSRPSYSSGSKPAPSFTPPKSPTFTPPSAPRPGGSRPTYSVPPPLPSPPPSAPRLGGRQYSSGGKTAPAGSGPGNQPGPSYDVNAGRAARQQESKETYRRYTSPGKSGSWGPPPPLPQPSPQRPAVVQGPRPAPSYTDNTGKQQPIDPQDARIDELRRQLDHERWVNRRQREEQFYRPWWSTPPVITYHDAYNPFFDFWLLQQSLDTQTLWLYNHRDTMDQQRYQDLLQKNRMLEDRVRQLEADKKPRDPTYTPPGIPPDLVYNDSYARSAYNPQQAPPPAPPVVAPRPGNFWPVFLTTLVVVLLIGFVVWLVFIQRWGGTPDERPANRPPERTGQP
jgi:hypothetical protein